MARAIFWGEVKDNNSLVTNSLVHEFLGSRDIYKFTEHIKCNSA
jgi:hypothetical protein